MHSLRLLALALFTAVLTLSLAADPLVDVLATERAWLDAYEQHDLEAMKRIVADDFVITYQDGNAQSKQDIVEWIAKASKAGRKGSKITTEATKAHRFGNHTIVLKGIVITQRIAKGETTTMRSHYTDTWVFLDGRWQVAASHLSDAPAK